jgi:hypothetical protein
MVIFKHSMSAPQARRSASKDRDNGFTTAGACLRASLKPAAIASSRPESSSLEQIACSSALDAFWQSKLAAEAGGARDAAAKTKLTRTNAKTFKSSPNAHLFGEKKAVAIVIIDLASDGTCRRMCAPEMASGKQV